MGDFLEDDATIQKVQSLNSDSQEQNKCNGKHVSTEAKHSLEQLLPALQQKITSNCVNVDEPESILSHADSALLGPLLEILQYLQQKTDGRIHTTHADHEDAESSKLITGMTQDIEKTAQVLGIDVKKINEVLSQVIAKDKCADITTLSDLANHTSVEEQNDKASWFEKVTTKGNGFAINAGTCSDQLSPKKPTDNKRWPSQLEGESKTNVFLPMSQSGDGVCKPLGHDCGSLPAGADDIAIKQEPDTDHDEFPNEGCSSNMVTMSGRNRGLGKANEPKFVCQICGDLAAGFHCGAYVCEACKKFYLRCLKSGGSVAYTCPKNQDCPISRETRSHCQFCRFKKCLQLGMYKPGRDDSRHLRVDFKSIPCKVCAAPSSGFHFGAITCEGCKGFFRRMVREKLHRKFVCMSGGGCDVASSNRTSCKACRFNKCLAIGMALQGTRLGRQSNSVKRSTLIEYQKQHGMDVALFPKLGEESTDVATAKVEHLLQSKAPEIQFKTEPVESDCYGQMPHELLSESTEQRYHALEKAHSNCSDSEPVMEKSECDRSRNSSGDTYQSSFDYTVSERTSSYPRQEHRRDFDIDVIPENQSDTCDAIQKVFVNNDSSVYTSNTVQMYDLSFAPPSPLASVVSSPVTPSIKVLNSTAFDKTQISTFGDHQKHAQSWLNFLSSTTERDDKMDELRDHCGVKDTNKQNVTLKRSASTCGSSPPRVKVGGTLGDAVATRRRTWQDTSFPLPSRPRTPTAADVAHNVLSFTSSDSQPVVRPERKSAMLRSIAHDTSSDVLSAQVNSETLGLESPRIPVDHNLMPDPSLPHHMAENNPEISRLEPVCSYSPVEAQHNVLSVRTGSLGRRDDIDNSISVYEKEHCTSMMISSSTISKRVDPTGTSDEFSPVGRINVDVCKFDSTRDETFEVTVVPSRKVHISNDGATASGSVTYAAQAGNLSREYSDEEIAGVKTDSRKDVQTTFSWQSLHDLDFMIARLLEAYRELENLSRPRAALGQDKNVQTEKERAWYAAYESFMHHAKYTLRFVKRIPGFKQLPLEDQVTLVREAVYPITLLFHSQFFDSSQAEKPRWFCNTDEEREKIWRFFPKFKELAAHIVFSGMLFRELQVCRDEYAFLCAMMVFSSDNFLVKDRENIKKIQESISNAMIKHLAATGRDPNRVGMLILRLSELKRANYEHKQIAHEVHQQNPEMDFSQLWHEMFLTK